MNVTIVGTGYVGLVTGTCLAEIGNDVTCLDIDEAKIAMLKQGQVPIYEPGLADLVRDNAQAGRLHFTTSLSEAMQQTNVVFLALPTPPMEDGSADLSAVLQVASQLGPLLSDFTVVVDKSTVPVGTSRKVHEAIAEHYKGEFAVVSNPEFLREGFAIADFMEPDRVVIGSSNPLATDIMKHLYRPLLSAHDDSRPLLVMDEASAELSKYAANTFLAMKISFINEIANLADLVGADVDNVAKAIGSDNRIGPRFLNAGIGYGGSCFPKDVKALGKTARDNYYDFKLLKAILEVNDRQQMLLTQRIFEHFGRDLNGKTFGVWGLAFKPDTDDIREAPALEIINNLLDAGAAVKAYDPEAMENVRRYYENKQLKPQLTHDAAAAASEVDGLVITTQWNEFRNLTADQLAGILSPGAVVFDGRNIYSSYRLTEHGLGYVGIGHPKSSITPHS